MHGNVLRRLAADAEAIVTLYREGMSLADLGIRWDCHSNTIKRFLVSQDVVLRRANPKRPLDQGEIIRMLDDGWEAQEVARMFHVRPETLAEFLAEKCAVIAPREASGRR